MAKNMVRCSMWLMLLIVSLVTTACVAHYGTTSVTVLPSTPPSTLSIFFPQQRPVQERTYLSTTGEQIIEKKVYGTAEMIGQLIVENRCLRLVDTFSKTSYLLVWQPEHSLHLEGETIWVRNETTGVAVRVGEEVCVSGGVKETIADLDQHLQQQLISGCPGPYWIVGLEVRPNVPHDSDLVTVDLISTADHTFFLVRKQPVLDEWIAGEMPLDGKLKLLNRCPQIVPADDPVHYTPIWPPDYWMRGQGSDIEIMNGAGQVAVRVGEKVRLSGGVIPVTWEAKGYRGLRKDLPCECLGPYWIVKGIE